MKIKTVLLRSEGITRGNWDVNTFLVITPQLVTVMFELKPQFNRKARKYPASKKKKKISI